MISPELAFLHKIHAEADIKCNIAITKNWNNYSEHRIYDKMFSGDTFFAEAEEIMFNKYIDKEDVYFSINSFRHPQKRSDDVWHLNAFVLDFDFYKISKYSHLTPDEMYEKVIEPKLTHKPTAVIDSGRGLYLFYAFQNCSRHMCDTYKAILAGFYNKFKKYGMDNLATNITQIVRLPNTINSKNGYIVTLLEYNETNYTISDFYPMMKYTKEQVDLFKEKQKVRRKKKLITSYDKNKSINNKKRKFQIILSDLKKIIRYKNEQGISEGYREYLIYIARKKMQDAGYSYQDEIDIAFALNELFLSPLADKDVTDVCKPAGKNKCPRVAKIILKLELDLELQNSLSFFKDKRLKDKAYHKHKRKHTLTNRTTKEQELMQRRTLVCGLKNKGYRNAVIADKLEINRSTVSRDLDYIKTNAWKFKIELKAYMNDLQSKLSDVYYKRKLIWDEQKKLSEWLRIGLAILQLDSS